MAPHRSLVALTCAALLQAASPHAQETGDLVSALAPLGSAFTFQG